jgi:N-hydroxyarylamine O-acetyltransferase
LTLFNARVTVRHAGGETQRRVLETPEEFAAVLREDFGLDLSDEDIEAMLRVMQARGSRGAPHPFFA